MMQDATSAKPSLRQLCEHGLHALALAALALALWILWQGGQAGPQADRTKVTPADLREWSLSPPKAIQLDLTSLPDAATRDWLLALAAVGSPVIWNASTSLPATGASLEPVPDPQAPLRLRVAAGASEPALTITGGAGAGLRDLGQLNGSGGVISLAPGELIAGFTTAAASPAPTPQASAVLHEDLTLKPVLVLARPSWEARFLIAALEEHGWQVDARLKASDKAILGTTPPEIVKPAPPPGRRQGGRGGRNSQGGARGETRGETGQAEQAAPPDPTWPELTTDAYAAIILTDDSYKDQATDIADFVTSGGGLILAGPLASAGMQDLLPARGFGDTREAKSYDSALPPREALELHPLSGLHEDSFVAERQDGDIAVALRRAGDGLVLQTGYSDLWRWQMSGTDAAAPEQYRRWVAGLVSSVAVSTSTLRAADLDQFAAADAAPLASWQSAFGPAERLKTTAFSQLRPRVSWLPMLFAIALLSLLAQWASRRLRPQTR